MEKAYDEAFWWLCAKNIKKAIEVIRRIPGAPAHPRLMMIMAALGGSVRKGGERLYYMSNQMKRWKENKMQEFMPEGLWRIFALLSGTDKVTVTQGCTGWQLGLAAHLWYRTCDGDGHVEIASALATYEETLRSLPEDTSAACQPIVTTKYGKPLPCDDLRYGLVREFVLGPEALHDIIVSVDTPTYSTEKMDSWLAWSVVLVLASVRDSPELHGYLHKLTLELVAEFQLHGEWESALHVAGFLIDDGTRQRVSMHILSSCDDLEKAIELVPVKWVWEAVGLRAAYTRDFVLAARAWLQSEHYTKCIDTIREHLLLPVVLSTGYDCGRDFVMEPARGASLEIIQWIYELVTHMLNDNHRDARLEDLRYFLEILLSSDTKQVKIETDFLQLVIPESAWKNI